MAHASLTGQRELLISGPQRRPVIGNSSFGCQLQCPEAKLRPIPMSSGGAATGRPRHKFNLTSRNGAVEIARMKTE
jgi:hypothetical protein